MTPSVGFLSFMTCVINVEQSTCQNLLVTCTDTARWLQVRQAPLPQHTVKACFVEQCEFSQINKLTRLSFCRYFCVRCVPPCLSITKSYCPVAKCCKVPFFKKKKHFSFFSFVKESRTVLRSWRYLYIMFPRLLSSSPGWDGYSLD